VSAIEEITAAMRERCLAGLAACVDAERLASGGV